MSKYFGHTIYKFSTAKLVSKHGKYYLHIPVTYEIEESNISDICNVVGIDRGINFVVATYDSKHKYGFVSGKAIKQKRANYSKLRKELQMRHTPSSRRRLKALGQRENRWMQDINHQVSKALVENTNYSKLRKELQMRHTPSSRRRLKALGQRENRWMQDINHQVSKALVENNPKHTLFVLEDLSGIRNATERVKTKDRYVSVSWSFYDLEQKLIYKAKQNQSSVIKLDPHYTSQCCPCCGHVEKRYVSVSWSFYDLEQKLIYKAKQNQSSVIKLDPHYTSQCCPCCGHVEKSNRNKKILLFTCKKCGYKATDDRIGAMNLYRMGINYLADSQVPNTVVAE